MKFYMLSPNTFQWKAILKGNKINDVLATIKSKEEFINEKMLPLKMDMIDSYENKKLWKGDTIFVDAITWSDDFTLGGNNPEVGAVMIISKSIKKVLENYNLPPHRFYPIDLKCDYVKEINYDYFLLQMIGDNFSKNEIVDFSKCTFIQQTRNDNGDRVTIEKYTEGIIENRVEYNEVKRNNSKKITIGSYLSKNGFELKNYFEFENEVYKYDYDVLWGVPDTIIVSEEIKKDIENLNVKNIIFSEINHNIIRSFEYEQMKNDGII
ncbi:hypothetical protein ACSIGC_03050 [Tenacibaculum sp. ZS6-P6]|uniref:hypothetical protein n=1 Tax=Tenacibaculum sp. ZS6-P6 TaxID=3447503 RepID=UPI003F9767DE